MLAQYAVRISLKVTLSECFCLKHEKGKDVRKLSIFLTYGTEYGTRYLCRVYCKSTDVCGWLAGRVVVERRNRK